MMKMKTNKTKTALITTLIVAGVALMVTTGFSYWLVSNQSNYKTENTFSNEDFDNSFSSENKDNYCEVNVYQAFGQAGEIKQETTEVTLSNSVDDWNTFEALIATYDIQIGDGYSETLNGSESGSGWSSYYNYYTYKAGTYYSAQTAGKDKSGNTIYACVLTITADVQHTYHHGALGIGSSDTYSGAYTTTINTASVGEPVVSDTYFGQLYVNKDSIITSKMFSSVFETIKGQYYFTGLIYSDSNLTTLFYLNETIVTDNTNLYVLFYEDEPYSLGLSSLTDAINNNTGTLKVSNSENSTYNLNNDISYDSTNNTVYVGYYDRDTTVGVDTEVNLCLTDGSVYTGIDYGSTSNQVANEASKTCDYTVKLTGDLIINGTMTVGADIGSSYNQGMQSQIYSHYVCLDLCGHEIDIYNYGELLVYGVIKDSIGNGSVHVYGGGTIQSVIVAYDAKGGGSTTGSFAFDVFPFSAYNLPYLQVPVFLEYDNNGWGSLDAYYVLNPFSTGATMIPGVLNIVGEDNGNGSDDAYLIALQKNSKTTYNESYVLINLVENSNVSGDTIKNTYTTNLCLERHLNFYFYNVDCELHHFTILFSISVLIIEIDMDLRSDQFDFPVSPMFSLYFYNSDFTIFSRVNFQKGSSLYMDKDSNLIFSHTQTTREFIHSSAIHSETIDVTGEVFFFDVADSTYTTASGSGAMYIKDRHSYGNVSNCNNFYQNTAFYKYAASSFKIAGSILFTEGNTTDTAYSIAGNVDCASIGTIISETNTVRQTFNFNTTDSMNYNPFNNLITSINSNSFECYFKTYDFDGVNGQFYYATLGYSASSCCDYMVLERGRSLPLISNGVAYAYNNIYADTDDLYSPNLVGTFNSGLSLIDAEGSFYYFNTDGEKPYLITGNNGTVQNSARNYIYNHNTKIVKCTYNTSTHLITDTDNNESVHVFFCSGYFPYTSEDGTSYVTLTRLLSKYNASGTTITDPLAISYNTTYNCWAMS